MKAFTFKARITVIFFVVYTILSAYLVGIFYLKSIFVQREQLRTRLMQVSALGASSITPDLVYSIKPDAASMKTSGYKELVGKLLKVKQIAQDISDAYILVQTDKPGIMKFVANADPEEIIECGEEFDITPYPEIFKAFEVPAADKQINQDKWGWWLSGYAPIKHKNGMVAGILGIDVSAKTIGLMQDTIKRNALYVFVVGIILAIIAGHFASWSLTKPMARLVEGMKEIRSGNLDHKIPIVSKDEFGRLSETFNEMTEKLKKYIKDLTETTKEKERLNKELEIAADLQLAMLPHYNISTDEVDLAGLSLPARRVGGDFFDYMNNDGDNIGVVIADATGKGLHSSIFMTNSKSIFKVLTTEETSPAKVMRRTNDLVIRNMDTSTAMFATMFYGIYDKKRKMFRYSNAGHNPPLYVDGDNLKVELLNAHGYPIGIYEDQDYGEDEISLKSGDAIVLYTDGVVEAMDDGGEMFGMDSLKKLVTSSMNLSSEDMMNKIREKIFEFAGDQAQFDDITLLVLRIK